MYFYIYQADVYCETCGDVICKELTNEGKAPDDYKDEYSYDSDDFPKGPYPEEYNESDIDQYCAHCQIYLENPLTQEGYENIKQEYVNCIVDGSNGIYVPNSFAEMYPQFLTEEQLSILSDPENEFYWDVWDEVLQDTKIKDDMGHEYSLHQDSDLFAVRCDLPHPLQEQLYDSL